MSEFKDLYKTLVRNDRCAELSQATPEQLYALHEAQKAVFDETVNKLSSSRMNILAEQNAMDALLKAWEAISPEQAEKLAIRDKLKISEHLRHQREKAYFFARPEQRMGREETTLNR